MVAYTCMIPYCKISYEKGIPIAFHKLPCNPIKRQKWIDAIKIEDLKFSSASRICSLHFTPESYVRNVAKRSLMPEAVPRIFNHPSEGLKRIDSKSTNNLSESESVENVKGTVKSVLKYSRSLKSMKQVNSTVGPQPYILKDTTCLQNAGLINNPGLRLYIINNPTNLADKKVQTIFGNTGGVNSASFGGQTLILKEPPCIRGNEIIITPVDDCPDVLIEPRNQINTSTGNNSLVHDEINELTPVEFIEQVDTPNILTSENGEQFNLEEYLKPKGKVYGGSKALDFHTYSRQPHSTKKTTKVDVKTEERLRKRIVAIKKRSMQNKKMMNEKNKKIKSLTGTVKNLMIKCNSQQDTINGFKKLFKLLKMNESINQEFLNIVRSQPKSKKVIET